MNERKTTAINLRMSPEVKELLRLAAAKEHRTLSNMLEYLVLRHCELSGVRLGSDPQALRPSARKQGMK